MVLRNLIAVAALSAMLFSSCTENKTTENAVVWKSKGDSLVTKTFDLLRNTLTKAIGEKGFVGAVEFCNTQALELTNSFTSEGITVKRSSDKLRNPANAPDTIEQRILFPFFN